MKSFLISDNADTYIGLRLAGIQGVILNDRQSVLDEFNARINDPEINILIITEKIADLIQDEVTEVKLKRRFPLIAEIPSSGISGKSAEFITDYIKESIGIKI